MLATSFEIDFIQEMSIYKFLGNEPYELHGVIQSGSTIVFDVECSCNMKDPPSGQISVRWKKIPLGKTQNHIVTLFLEAGYPTFDLNQIEFDFKTTFIDVNKSLSCIMSNNGNASCNFKAICESPLISMDIIEGIIIPGETITSHITFKPISYESHTSSIHFVTDAGTYSVLCSGVVGVPYLKIPKELLIADFGVKTIERQHIKKFEIFNTGLSNIDYDFVWNEIAKNGEKIGHDEFDVFTCEPTHGTILPGNALTLTITLFPKEYGVIYTGSYTVRTIDGERYNGSVRAVGGMSIIKIKPPTISSEKGSLIKAQATRELNNELHGNYEIEKPKKATLFNQHIKIQTADQQDTSRYIIQSHMENLYDLLAGLSLAEQQHHKFQLDLAQNEPLVPTTRTEKVKENLKTQGKIEKLKKSTPPNSSFKDIGLVESNPRLPLDQILDGSGNSYPIM